MALLLFQIIFRRRKRKAAAQNKKSGEKLFWPGLDSEFYRLEARLAARGVPRQPSEPLADWLERALAEPALADLRAQLREFCGCTTNIVSIRKAWTRPAGNCSPKSPRLSGTTFAALNFRR